MKTLILLLVVFPVLAQAIQLEVQVAPEISKYIRKLEVTLAYRSTKNEKGCYVVKPMDEYYEIIKKNEKLNATGGIIDFPAAIDRCSAILVGIYFDGKQIRNVIKKETGDSAAQEINRFDLGIQADSAAVINPVIFPMSCKLANVYVAESANLRQRLSCHFQGKNWFDPKTSKVVVQMKPF